jgi:uncharacterized membrane protein YgdD (TMEM256/DUF423 family)
VARVDQVVLVLAAVLGALAVGSGAFGAHGLKHVLDASMMSVYQTAVNYHLAHALALGLIGLLLRLPGNIELAQRWFRRAALLFLFGLLLFCGSLYALSLSGLRWLGMITPLGGLCFIAGWLALAFGASKR